jgi:hypothetical protein
MARYRIPDLPRGAKSTIWGRSLGFAVAGGALAITTQYSVGLPGDPVPNTLAQDWMTSIPGGICDASITNQLETLYTSDGPACTGPGHPWTCCTGSGQGTCTPVTSPNLLTLIATAESTYAQFANISANGLFGLWPHESPRGNKTKPGAFIGLMQVPVQMSTAWNWLTNTQEGADTFNQKLGYISTIQNEAAAQPHTPAQPLTQLQAEYMTVFQYGAFASPTNLSVQYYTVQKSGTQYLWLPKKLTKAQKIYMNKVFDAAPPDNPCD